MFQKKSSTELHSNELQNNKANYESDAPKKRYLFPEKRQQIIDDLRLI